MSVVSTPSAGALAPRPIAPPSVWLDLIFVAVTLVLIICAAVTQSIMVAAFTLLPAFYVLLVILVRRPIWAFGTALVVQNFSGLIKQEMDYSQAAYLVQDVSFLIVFIPLILRRIMRPPTVIARQPWTIIDTLLVLFIAFSVVQAFNPASPSPLLALAAVRVRFLPMLMYVFVRGLARDGYKLEKPLFYTLMSCALCGALFAIYETHIGINGVKALGPGFWPKQMSRVWGDASGVEHFRPPSIYTDAGIAVVVAGMFAFMALLRPYRMSLAGNIFRYGAVLVCITQVIVTGSRSGFLAIVAGFLFLAVLTRSRVMGFLLLGLPVVLAVTLMVQPKMLDRYASLANPAAAYSENRGYTLPRILYNLEHYPMGFGTGTATLGAGSVSSVFRIAFNNGQDAVLDNGWANILHEAGVLGLVLYAALLLTIFGSALTLARRAPPGRAYLPLTMAVWSLIILISTFGTVITDSFPVNVYYWSTLALMLSQANTSPRPAPPLLTGDTA